MPVDFKINNNTGLGRNLVERVRRQMEDALNDTLPELRDEIVSRTQSGRSINGGGFEAYSAAYAAATGKTTPNLTLSGDMLGSMDTSVSRNIGFIEGRIEIQGGFNRSKADWNQGGNSNIPARPFMGLSREQERRLIDAIGEAFIRLGRS